MVQAITTVWTEVMEWITTALTSVQDVFYTAGTDGGTGSLTFLGILAVIGVAIGIAFLVDFYATYCEPAEQSA